MNIILPHNIFTSLLLQALPDNLKPMVSYQPSSLLAPLVADKKADIALVPVTDIIKHKDLFVSQSRGISFDGMLSNSYLYFQPESQHVSEIALAGDISSIEAILSKIIIKELYDEEISLRLLSSIPAEFIGNLLIAGDQNYYSDRFLNGLNLAEEVIELLNLPFVNFVFCSNEEAKLEWLEKETAGIENKIYSEVENTDWDFRLSESAKTLFRENISHVLYEFEEQDKEGIIQLLRLPYFHGLVDDMFDIRFV